MALWTFTGSTWYSVSSFILWQRARLTSRQSAAQKRQHKQSGGSSLWEIQKPPTWNCTNSPSPHHPLKASSFWVTAMTQGPEILPWKLKPNSQIEPQHTQNSLSSSLQYCQQVFTLTMHNVDKVFASLFPNLVLNSKLKLSLFSLFALFKSYFPLCIWFSSFEVCLMAKRQRSFPLFTFCLRHWWHCSLIQSIVLEMWDTAATADRCRLIRQR